MCIRDSYYSRLHIDTAKLASLLDEIDKINTGDKENDIIGRVYEYFLSKFALAEGKGKGEFYTPKCIVNLIAEMIEPYDGILYDPCCGSGGMFVQSMKFVEAHHGNKKKVSIYGQEYTNTTYKPVSYTHLDVYKRQRPPSRATVSPDAGGYLKSNSA